MNDTRDIYAYLVALHGFDPLGEREVVAEAEALTGGAA